MKTHCHFGIPRFARACGPDGDVWHDVWTSEHTHALVSILVFTTTTTPPPGKAAKLFIVGQLSFRPGIMSRDMVAAS